MLYQFEAIKKALNNSLSRELRAPIGFSTDSQGKKSIYTSGKGAKIEGKEK
jgi:hypothetical protein